MEKLKSKVFYTVFLIFTITLLSLTVAFNLQKYIEKKNNIITSMESVSGNTKKEPNMNSDVPPPKDDEKGNIKFLDSIIYTVLIDENNNIKEVINHSNNDINSNDIKQKAKTILNKKDLKTTYTGFLYLSDYSYHYEIGDSLIILDNKNVKQQLLYSLYISLFIFTILEILAFLISKLITDWITIPVRNTFDKQKQFIADASHELKTPLSVILASSEALEEDPKETKWIKNIQNEANRMNTLITDLLNLAASEKKELFDIKENNLSKVVELSVLTFEGKAYEKKIKLEYNIEENIITKFDENNIRQLVEILLDNAIEHSKKENTVYLSLCITNGQIKLEVTNEGSEIPKGEEEKIFERFYRVDKSRNRKTSRYGLGLAIAKNIVLNHNGEITASSKDNTTTFKVLLKK